MKLYYRISDQSYDKPKLIGATKEVCLMNFFKAFAPIIFKDPENPPIRIIADRCERKTIKMLQETGSPLTITDLGNAGSLRLALEMAIDECEPGELVYFCEDDYLHLGSAPFLLQEGIRRAEYITLYDHPDKYTRYYNGGEFSKVIKTDSSHWRYTASTCMTFGTKTDTLREDIEVWKKYTGEQHPHDHHIFMELDKESGRRLAVCIPGVACHTDLHFSGMVNVMLMESWAIDMMIDELGQQLERKHSKLPAEKFLEQMSLREKLLEGKTGPEKLLALDALLKA